MVYNYTTSSMPIVPVAPLRGDNIIRGNDERYLVEAMKQIHELHDGWQGDPVEISRPITAVGFNRFRSLVLDFGLLGCPCAYGRDIPFGTTPVIMPGAVITANDYSQDREAVLRAIISLTGVERLYGSEAEGDYVSSDVPAEVYRGCPIERSITDESFGVLARRAVIVAPSFGGTYEQKTANPDGSSYWYFTDTRDSVDLVGSISSGSNVAIWSCLDYGLSAHPMQAMMVGSIRGTIARSNADVYTDICLVLAIPMTQVTQTLEMDRWYTRTFTAGGGMSSALVRSRVTAALSQMGITNPRRVYLNPNMPLKMLVIDGHKMPYNEFAS